MSSISSTAERAILSLCAEVSAHLGRPERDELQTIITSMHAAVRIAVVGRVNSGKSTLVNALIGRRIAATAAQDCTRFVTEYRFGAPESAVAVYDDGRREPLGLDLVQLGGMVPTDHLTRIEVTLQSKALTHVTLIDTPGLAGLENDFRWDSEEARAAGGAELLVYLFRGSVRTDDVTVAREFATSTGASPTATHCIGLLSHADNFGSGAWGEHDPIDQAGASAARLHRSLSGCFSAVIPISPLLAETVRTGHLTEDDARALRRFADVDPTMLQYAGQLASDPDAKVLTALSSLVGPYGLRHGRDHGRTAGELGDWLEGRSGILSVERHLADLLPTLQMARAERAAQLLTQAARRWGPHASRLIEAAHYGPRLQPIREFRSYRLLRTQCPDSRLIAPLVDLLSAADLPQRLSLLNGAGDPRGEAARLSASYQAQIGEAQRGPEADAARTLAMSYLYLCQDLDEAGYRAVRTS